jgi:hypothetical protein
MTGPARLAVVPDTGGRDQGGVDQSAGAGGGRADQMD